MTARARRAARGCATARWTTDRLPAALVEADIAIEETFIRRISGLACATDARRLSAGESARILNNSHPARARARAHTQTHTVKLE